MTRRLMALLVKELAEHALVLTFVAMLCAGGFLLFLLAALGAPATVTYLEAHANFTRFALPFCAMALGHRLVVVELSGRTQRFLESLPMHAAEPLVVKWVFGAVVLGGMAVASLVVGAAVAAFREPIDAPFLALVATRTLVALGTAWTFFFAMGLLGKARVPLYLLLSLGLIVISAGTSIELMRFGPFMLLGPDFVLERSRWPWRQLLESLGMMAAFLVLSAIVTRIREGSVDERLSKPMSQRELAFTGIATFALLTLWGGLEGEAQPDPYVMASDHVAASARLPLAVGYVDDDARDDAERLLARLEADVGSLAEAAGWTSLPQLRVVLRRSLDPSLVEHVGLAVDDGVLLRANFTDDARDPSLISAELIGALFDARTRGRAELEPRLFLRDGISAYWATRSDPDGRARRRAHALLATRERGPDPARIRAFLRTRERDGRRGAAALAGTGIEALFGDSDGTGPRDVARFGALVARTFASGAPDDVRASVAEWLDPMPRRIAETTGVALEDLFPRWQAHLDRLRADGALGAIVGPLRALRAETVVEPGDSPTIVVRATLPPGTTLTVRHLEAGPFDSPVTDFDLHAESAAAADAASEVRIAGTYGPGSRVIVAADVTGTALRAPFRLYAERLALP